MADTIVQSVMNAPPVCLDAKASVREAANRMWANQVGSILALEDGNVVGIVTERDFTWMIAEGGDLQQTSLESIMSSPVVTIEPAASIELAIERMIAEGVKRLVVELEGEVRGVVSVTDIAYAEPDLARRARQDLRAHWEG